MQGLCGVQFHGIEMLLRRAILKRLNPILKGQERNRREEKEGILP
jgi:hypothetical protein